MSTVLLLVTSAETATIAGVIASLLTGGGMLYLARSRRKLNEAQTVEALTNAAMALVTPLQSENAHLRDRTAEQTKWSQRQDEAIKELQTAHEDCLRREAEVKGEVVELSRRVDGLEH